MATREQIYQEQLKALGIYDPAFDPEIKTLAKLERRKTRVEKEWSETAPKGGKPSFLDPHYAIITQLERDILTHRETLGLTPKAMRRIKGAYYETVRAGALVEDDAPRDETPASATVLDFVKAKFGA